MKVAKYYWPDMMWIEIAAEQGWFDDAGLNVELTDTNSDYFACLDQMTAGELDTNSFTLFDLLVRVAAGAGLAGVINQDYSFGAKSLIAKAEINNVAGLRGPPGFAARQRKEY